MTVNSIVVNSTQATVVVEDRLGNSVGITTSSPASIEIVKSGVIPGGLTHDVLVKRSSDDFDTEWADELTLDRISFDTLAGESVSEGQLAWNADEQTLDLGRGGGATLQLGSTSPLVRNSTASTIPNGTAVMFAGTLGNSGRLLVAPMVADGTYPGYVFLGITTQAIAAGADGFVTTFGKVRQVNTSAFTEGAILWCDPAVPGGLTETEPQAPNLKLPVAAVISSKNNGILMVRSDTGRRLQDLHDVEANGATEDGDLLTYVAANERWEAKPPKRTNLILESQQVISEDYTLTAGYNGLSAGPVVVADGYTVTVPDGAVWRIV
ncbi:MAG: hypothetical protein ACO24H_03345 [Polynucleobacter sp.]